MNALQIDAAAGGNKLIVSGDVSKLLENNRARRVLDDHTTYMVEDGAITVDVSDSLGKTIKRITSAAARAGCMVGFSPSANANIQKYREEENEFIHFSQKALQIRNNECSPNELKSFVDSLDVNLPSRRLYPLQILAAFHLAFSQNACNFSVPGAGKTSIVYGAYAYLRHLSETSSKNVDRLLIICPLNAFGPWELEYTECFGKDPVSQRISGQLSLDDKKQYFYQEDPAEITLISYASVVSLVDEIKQFLHCHRVMVVLDEAHKIKNTDGGITATSIQAIAENCAARVVLTGTPAPNGYEDLYNLFKFIWPRKDIIRFQVGQLKDMSKSKDDDRVGTLLSSIAPYYIRIKKRDLGIPDATIHEPVVVDMGARQRRIYDYIEQKFIPEIAEKCDKDFQRHLVKARMIRLQQAATNPALLVQPLSGFYASEGMEPDEIPDDSEFMRGVVGYEDKEIPSKYIAALELIKKHVSKGEKVIVWACFVQNVQRFGDFLKSQGIESRALYGATPIAGSEVSDEDEAYCATREAIVRKFHEPNCSYRVVIANPFAVAESISLHRACHNAIYLERSFNAAHFLQSKDRIHRYGLSPDIRTNYYFLVAKDSIDETIHVRLAAKEARLLEIIESMPIPLFSNVEENAGDEDIKAVLRDYARRIKRL